MRLIPMGLNDSHVDIFLEHLGSTMREMKTDEKDIEQAIALSDKFRNYVLGR